MITTGNGIYRVVVMKTSKQFLIFTAIGAVGTGGHYVTLILLVQLMHIAPVPATTAGFAVGALINYILNYRITFNSNKRHREALTKFLIVASIGAATNAGIMLVGRHFFDVHYMVIQLLATTIVMVFNFTASKHWTFSENNADT